MHRIILLIALVLAAPASAREMPAGPPPGKFGKLQSPQMIADRIHVMRQPDRLWALVIGNVTIVEQEAGFVLIDSGSSYADGSRIVAHLRAMSDKPVKAVVITHWHNDHPLGLSAIVEAWPDIRIISTVATRDAIAKVLGPIIAPSRTPERDLARLNGRMNFILSIEKLARDPALGEHDRQQFEKEAAYARGMLDDPLGTWLVHPTEVFTDRLTLPDAHAPIELMWLGRANTEGDALAWLPKQRVLVTGDIVVAPTPYGFGSFPKDWLSVLEQLKAFDFATLIPGHGPPQSDRDYIEKLITSLTEVRAQVGPLAAKGLSLEAVREQVDYTAMTMRFVGEDSWARRWFKEYWLEPITASAYREAKGLPTEQRMVN